jgi:hypothetical protein
MKDQSAIHQYLRKDAPGMVLYMCRQSYGRGDRLAVRGTDDTQRGAVLLVFSGLFSWFLGLRMDGSGAEGKQENGQQ